VAGLMIDVTWLCTNRTGGLYGAIVKLHQCCVAIALNMYIYASSKYRIQITDCPNRQSKSYGETC
jgi:hypothetical protein